MTRNERFFSRDPDFLEKFNIACDETIQAKYILAEGKISALLQIIAGNKYLYEFFKNAVDGFDFSREFSASQTSGGKRASLSLPSNPVKLTAYVFCLLLQFDTRGILLKDFLHTYFYSELGANVEYERFVIDILVPFKHCVDKLLGQLDEPQTDSLTADIFSDLTAVLSRMGEGSEELAFLLAALKKGIDSDDKLLTQTAFIGSKNTAKAAGVLDSIAIPLEKIRVYLIGTGVLQ